MPNYNYDEDRVLSNLIKIIRRTNINASKKEELVDYVTKIKTGRANNDFFDIPTLEVVILDLIDEKKSNQNLYDLINAVKFALPLGKETENYEEIKNMILNGNIFNDKELLYLFNDRSNYIMFMRILKEKGLLEDKEKFRNIVDFAINVKPLCINEDIFKGELLSYVNGLVNELDSLEDYKLRRIIEAKKRSGIYPIGEETLAQIAQTCEKIMNLTTVFDDMEIKVRNYQEIVSRQTREGIQRIDIQTAQKIKQIEVDIDKAKEEALKKLDTSLEDMESTLKSNSDLVFNQILEESTESLRKLRDQAKSVSTTTASELIRINQAKEEVLKSIKDNPELQAILNSPLLKQKLQETIKSMSADEIKVTTEIKEPAKVVEREVVYKAIEEDGTIIVPYGPALKIPELGLDYEILPAFDERINFKERFKKVMDRKHQREDKGEFFHPMIDEIITDIMEGDLVQLYGPSGTGKTTICKQASSLIGLDVEDEIGLTDKAGIMGYNDPQGRFRVSQAFKAALNGKMLLIDEIDISTPEMLIVVGKLYSDFLNGLYNGQNQEYVTFGENTNIPINPNFRMIAAGNTDGLGADIAYSSRRKLDESFLERVRPIFIDFDNRVEEKIFGKYKDWYNYFITFRAACSAYYLEEKHKRNASIQGNATTRDARAIVRYIEHDSKTVDQIIREQFVQIKDDKYLSFIENFYANKYRLPNKMSFPDLRNVPLSKVSEQDLAKSLVKRIRENRNNG